MSLISNQIAQYEQRARSRHFAAVRCLEKESFPGWFNGFLGLSVLPPLVRIGFDREIASNIFKISAPAWKSMGPVIEQKLKLHPSLIRDIREIRDTLIAREEKKSQYSTFCVDADPGEMADIAKKAMRPDTLPQLLQTIPTSWIILPRAHAFLVKMDAHCLVLYLQHMNCESNLAFEKTLARILTEFIGNYSLKFITASLPKKQMMEAIFYGYAAMFWKNLLQPPHGLEDLLVFRNYLSWVQSFMKRAADKSKEKRSVLAEMMEMEKSILPDKGVSATVNRKKPDAGCFHITLRHGRPGINHAVRYFTMNSSSKSGNRHNHLLSRTLPRQLNTLFRELRRNHDSESPGTRAYIHTFLTELRTVYSTGTPGSGPNRRKSRGNLDFTRGRMAHLIQDFGKSLQ